MSELMTPKTPRECFDNNINIYNSTIITGLTRGRIMNLFNAFRMEDIVKRTQDNSDRINTAKTMESELFELIERTRDCLTVQINDRIELLSKQLCLYCA